MEPKEKSVKFRCKKCDKTMETSHSDNDVPKCCDLPMEKIEEAPFCHSTATAEHARADEMMEPCDDGRSGKMVVILVYQSMIKSEGNRVIPSRVSTTIS